jgi:hypothetical protein
MKSADAADPPAPASDAAVPTPRAGTDPAPTAGSDEGGPPAAGSGDWARRPGRGVALVLALVAGLAALSRLNDALGKMHLPGRPAGSFSGVSGPASLWSPTGPVQAIVGWHEWDRTNLGVGHGIHVLTALILLVVVDLLLLTLPVAAIVHAATRPTRSEFQTRPATGGAMATASDLAAVAHVAYGRTWLVMFVGGTVVRDVVLLVAWSTGPDAGLWLLRAAGGVTVLAWLAVVVPVLLTAYARLAADIDAGAWTGDRPGGLRRAGRLIVILRMQIIAASVVPAILAALGGDLGEQIDDLAFRWPQHWPTLLWAVLGAALLCVLLRATGYMCRDWYAQPLERQPSENPNGWPLTIVGGLLLAGYVFSVARSAPWGLLLFPGIMFLALGVVTNVERHRTKAVRVARTTAPDLRMRPLTDAAIPIISAVPLGALAYIGVRSGVTLIVRDARVFSPGTSYLVGAALAFVACWFTARLGEVRPRLRPAATVVFAATAVVFAGLAVAGGVWPIRVGQAVGAMAILFVFSGVLLLVLVGIVYAVRHRGPSAPLSVLRIRRVPVLTFLTLWLVVTSTVEGTDHYHDVRLLPVSAGSKPRPVTPSAAVSQWLADHAGAGSVPGTGTRRPVSMVFVATSGGGIRSAYWTNLVLDCLFDPDAQAPDAKQSCAGPRLDETSVFVESGVSGGAFGIAVHRQLAGADFGDVLSNDFVSPDIATMVFRDAPAFWIPAPFKPSGHDRAAVMEQSWEAATHRAMAGGLFASAYQPGTNQLQFPITMFDSASIDDGCRFNVSVFAAATKDETASSTGCYTLAPFAPRPGLQVGSAGYTPTPAPGEPVPPTGFEPVLAGTKDLYDYLCSPGDTRAHDIAMSSASLLAARFPYISPTGGLTGCNNDPTTKQSRTFTMDGGVIDDSGTSPLGELWSGIAGQIADYDNDPTKPSCVEPRLLIIDNGYADPAPAAIPAQPQELVAPVRGQSAVRNAATSRAEQRTALEFQHAFGSVVCHDPTAVPPQTVPTRVALIAPSARPGPFAPLGWSLSGYATADLADQLGSIPNRCELAVVRTWFLTATPDPFAPGGACAPGQPTSAASSSPP